MRPWKEHAVDHIISVSSAVAKAAGVMDLPNSSVIPNFVPDVTLKHRSETEQATTEVPLPDTPFLLFVGDLCEEKGVLTLLRAYESMPPNRPPLVLIGKRRPDTPASLPDGVAMHFNWPHDHVMQAFRRCLFAVAPSTCPDACPTTVLEAMACGRPVVTTPVGGIVDMVTDGKNGLVVRPSSKDSLASAMSRLVEDGNLRSRLAAGALDRVRPFTTSAVVDRIEEIYRRVARSPGDVAVGESQDVREPC
jgi:glycosyltransferase involved in cell wall biosynthesis